MRNKIENLTISILLFCFTISCTKSDSDTNDVAKFDSIRVGGLYSLTGSWSSLGKTSAVATELAVESINNYLTERQVNFRFSYKIYDTRLDTLQCISSLNTAINIDKINYFIGPQSSAELAAIRSKVDMSKIFVVSQGSTASSLAIPGDAIFRFCPGDKVEGKAVATTMWAKGKSYVITVSRNDAGGTGLQDAVGNYAQSLGAQVFATTPYSVTTTDYSSVIASIKSKIQENINLFNSGKIAVFIASFDETKDFFKQASAEPLLSQVDWYGCDGIVLSDVFTADAQACEFAIKTNFIAPNFAVPSTNNAERDKVISTIKSKTSIEPDGFALAVYDALWVLARTLSSYPNSRNDIEILKTNFLKEANQFNGITGPTALDQNGDRSIGSFDYFGIQNNNGKYSWVFKGKSN